MSDPMILSLSQHHFIQVDNSMQVNSVKVPEADIMATNGVVHFVKTLLYPKGINAPSNP